MILWSLTGGGGAQVEMLRGGLTFAVHGQLTSSVISRSASATALPWRHEGV